MADPGASSPDTKSVQTGPGLGAGFIGGAIGGLLGGGSGVFFVPALEKLTALPRPALHGTAGAGNIAVTGIGAATFALVGGSINLRAGTGLVLGAIVGGFFGAKLILRVPQRLLRWLFIGILLVTCIKLYLDAAGADPLEGSAVLPETLIADLWFTVPVSLVLGGIIGAWSAGMGSGGGFLAVPTLILLFGTGLPVAEGTSLLMFFPNSIVGTIVHARQGTADIRAGAVLNLGAAPGAVLGALVALVIDVTVLSVLFATFALFIAVREISRMYRRPSATTTERGSSSRAATQEAGASMLADDPMPDE